MMESGPVKRNVCQRMESIVYVSADSDVSDSDVADSGPVFRPLGTGKSQLATANRWDSDDNMCKTKLHDIVVETGQDIVSKVKAIQGPRLIWIVSAKGAVTNASIHTSSGASVTFEGSTEIASLEGAFFLSEPGGHNRKGDMTAYLVGSDGEVVGGHTQGMLIAAGRVEVTAFSLIPAPGEW